MIYFNKKGVSEIITYILVLSLIVITSLIAYNYSNEKMNEKINELDYENMHFYLKKTQSVISEINNFEGSSKSIFLSFKNGLLIFQGNQIKYISSLDFNFSLCDNNVCEENINGTQTIYTNLTSGYTFKENFTLEPDLYQIILINLKNESKYEVVIK